VAWTCSCHWTFKRLISRIYGLWSGFFFKETGIK
jgi:hypothetical protein